MPRRATLTYSSEDALAAQTEQVYVYYCKYSGLHTLTTNCNLSKAPRRRTDGSRVIDTRTFTAKLYTSDGGNKLIKRQSGAIEKQYRYNIGKLPVAYRTEPDGRFLYILEDAVSSYSSHDPAQGNSPPVPPCISALDKDTTQVSLEIDDRADKPAIMKISADHVRMEIVHAITAPETNEEILEVMRAILAVRLSQMSLIRGESTRHKLLMVQKVKPADIYQRLQKALRH